MIADVPLVASTGKRAILSTTAAEEAVKALGEEDELLLLNALKLVASIAAHPGKKKFCVRAACKSMYIRTYVCMCIIYVCHA